MTRNNADLAAGRPDWDVVVVGAGAGGICAALAAARGGARTLLIEQGAGLGGTGVFSPVGLVCQFYDRAGRAVNTGIHRELFPEPYRNWRGTFNDSDPVPVYDERILAATYARLIAAESRLALRLGRAVTAVRRAGRVMTAVCLDDGDSVTGRFFVDGTADGNLGALAGVRFDKGRPEDGRMMTATLTFKLSGVRPALLKRSDLLTWGGIRGLRAELDVHYHALKTAGGTQNLRAGVLCFPYPDGVSLLFNSTAVAGVDPTDAATVRAGYAAAERQVHELVAAVCRHPALADARLEFIAPRLGVREGRRIRGDYVLTQQDCMTAAHFDDMCAACAYGLDVHDPDGGRGRVIGIPAPGYYHIPYRALIAADLDNLALGSRCISGDFVAHSSYRVMSGVTAIGQAAGTAAALAAGAGVADLRQVAPEALRAALCQAGQFIE